jgi:hypothetical protein
MDKKLITINVDIDVPEGEHCNNCTFKTPTINLYSKPICLIFKQELKYELGDFYVKCDSCKNLTSE